ncbi:hypothetical protein OF001_U40150 [Pseudomonas sp. OF001]|nr:hypothetical protein OF001_U40150 [Pseudomonas sp. OF001]
MPAPSRVELARLPRGDNFLSRLIPIAQSLRRFSARVPAGHPRREFPHCAPGTTAPS